MSLFCKSRAIMSRISIILTLCCLGVSAHAYDYIADEVAYTITSTTNKTVEVAGYNYSGAIIVPEQVVNEADGMTYTVTGVGMGAFAERASVTSITLPNTVTYLANSAFYACIGLTRFTIPESVVSIGIETFISCINLSTIRIPAKVELIDRDAFMGCSSMYAINVDEANEHYSSINGTLYDKAQQTLVRHPEASTRNPNIPSTVTRIESRAFWSCKNVSTINLPEGLTSIGDDAFFACKEITNMHIPESVMGRLGNGVFRRCSKLAHVDIPSRITEIGQYAFELCNALSTIELPDAVTLIDSYAFDNCSGLSNINMPTALKKIGRFAFHGCGSVRVFDLHDGLEEIGEQAFAGCWNLTQFCVPEGVTRLGDRLFENCTSLASISLPSTLQALGSNPFNNCSQLNQITVADGNPYLSVIGGILYSENNTLLVFCPRANSGENGLLVVPEGVTTIGEYGLAQLTQATEIDLPLSLTSIKSLACYQDRNIRRFCIPAGVNEIMPFSCADCYGLEELYCYLPEPLPIDIVNVFEGRGVWNIKLFVPEASIETYKNAEGWRLFGDTGVYVYPMKPGDMNLDGVIDVSDINAVINIMLGKSYDAMLKHNADINRDKRIDVSDVNNVINIMLGKLQD